jgi:hypothetical protein
MRREHGTSGTLCCSAIGLDVPARATVPESLHSLAGRRDQGPPRCRVAVVMDHIATGVGFVR